MVFSERLKELRLNESLLQKDIAKVLNVRNTTVSAWETGDNEPDIETIKKLASFYDVTLDYLLDYDHNEFSVKYNYEKEKLNIKRKNKEI